MYQPWFSQRPALSPSYGVGALLADALLTPVAWSLPLLFLGGAIVTSVLEYFTGWLLETLFHAKWWDYSNKKWNLHGRVCLRNSDPLRSDVRDSAARSASSAAGAGAAWIPDPALTVLCAVLAAAFLADLVFSVRGALQLRGKLEALQEILDELRERTETALEEQKTAVRAAVSTWEQRARTGREETVERLRSGRPGWRAVCALRTED
ncbi:MAG: putative ABC transporter permease [Oscillospiraceae bacterium]